MSHLMCFVILLHIGLRCCTLNDIFCICVTLQLVPVNFSGVPCIDPVYVISVIYLIYLFILKYLNRKIVIRIQETFSSYQVLN